MLRLSAEARTPSGDPLEILFYLAYDCQHGWLLTIPVQEQQTMRVIPMMSEIDHADYANTLLEIHSHHQMAAFFSATDTADEQGFRLYGVVGCLDRNSQHAPQIRMRVGIYGHFWEIAASTVLSLSWGMTDCVIQDQLRNGEPKTRREETPDGA
jgi:PRTRC genetic system protein A